MLQSNVHNMVLTHIVTSLIARYIKCTCAVSKKYKHLYYGYWFINMLNSTFRLRMSDLEYIKHEVCGQDANKARVKGGEWLHAEYFIIHMYSTIKTFC